MLLAFHFASRDDDLLCALDAMSAAGHQCWRKKAMYYWLTKTVLPWPPRITFVVKTYVFNTARNLKQPARALIIDIYR